MRAVDVADRGRFVRAEPRVRVREYVSGLVAGLERKNGWTLAERAGEVSPDGMQRLLRKADWDVDGVREADDGMIVLTLPEIRRLIVNLVLRHTNPVEHVWAWSRWRRRRQHQARLSHYKRCGHPLTQVPLH